MQWLTNSRFAVLGLMGTACLAACTESSAPSTGESTIDAAYAALVADIANCAKQVKLCTDAAGSDAAANDACREEFGACRDGAGKQGVPALASAVRSCTSQQKECVRAADRGEASSCQHELRTCLRAAQPAEHGQDDTDAGSDERKAVRSDCLDELHTCVDADGPANACAEKVRVCLVDSVPSPSEVVPDADEDEPSGDVDEADKRAGSGMPSEAGSGRRKNGADAEDAGPRSHGMMSEARMCVDSLRACIDSGSPARGCAQSLKACRETATP